MEIDMPPPTNTSEDRELLFQQYKMFVEMADKVSDRRQTANTYFLTLQSGLLALVSVIDRSGSQQPLWILTVVGILLSLLWYATITAYKNLNGAKFLVIHDLEKRLLAAPYTQEWAIVDRGRNRSKYWPVSHIESWVPWIFTAFHLIVFLFRLPLSPVTSLRSAILGS